MGINYVDEDEFHKEVVTYTNLVRDAKAAKTAVPEIPEHLAENVLKIAEHLARRSNFSGYTFRDDMIGDGVEDCIRALLSGTFKENPRWKAFSYYTMICSRAFVRRIVKEKKHVLVFRKVLANLDPHKFAEGAGDLIDRPQFVESYRHWMEITQKEEEFFRRKKERQQNTRKGEDNEEFESDCTDN